MYGVNGEKYEEKIDNGDLVDFKTICVSKYITSYSSYYCNC
jgi:hypothetical protein